MLFWKLKRSFFNSCNYIVFCFDRSAKQHEIEKQQMLEIITLLYEKVSPPSASNFENGFMNMSNTKYLPNVLLLVHSAF